MRLSLKSAIKWFVPYGIVNLWAKKPYSEATSRVSYGAEHPDKTFYVIGRNCKADTGLMWIVMHTLSHILYAEARGYIPVVDLLNNKSQYSENGRNVWEDYFEQPGGYAPADIARSKNIVLCGTASFVAKWRAYDKEHDSWYRKKFHQYIRLNDQTREYVDRDFHRILKGKHNVLGVLCRGTDYLLKKPSGHPIQPAPESVVSEARAVMSERNCSYLYLATEDQQVFELFKAEFGDSLLTNDQLRYNREDFAGTVQRISDVTVNRRDRDKYFTNLEYLSSLHLLSRCDYFIGGNNGGTKGVFFLGPHFTDDHVWHLGQFP